jgi:AraC-like DNA-binding protein
MWSLKFEKCVNCGTTEIMHSARGLCVRCYNQYIESKHKQHKRIRGVAGNKITQEYLNGEYVESNKSLADIAKECGCSRQYVYKKMKQYEIQLRSQAKARELAYDKNKISHIKVDENGNEREVLVDKINVNEDFFASWSDEMAYVLGVIYTDGCLHAGSKYDHSLQTKGRAFRFDVAQKEPELLTKVLNLMGSNAKLYHIKRREYVSGVAGELFRFSINNNKVYNDLIKLGLTPRKSRTIDFPNMPEKCIRHFMRGCWDGDGSVYIEKRNSSIAASFTSGSLKFIKGLLKYLEIAGLPSITIHTHRGKNLSYYFRFRDSSCLQLYHYLYDDVPPEQYLSRKHDIFFNFFRLVIELEKRRGQHLIKFSRCLE